MSEKTSHNQIKQGQVKSNLSQQLRPEMAQRSGRDVKHQL